MSMSSFSESQLPPQKSAATELASLAGIPSGWDVRVTDDCKVYYVDHSNQVTQWRHPVDKIRRSTAKDLPPGWNRDRDSSRIRLYKHVSGKTMYMDPRVVMLFDESRVRLPPKKRSLLKKMGRGRGKPRRAKTLPKPAKKPNGALHTVTDAVEPGTTVDSSTPETLDDESPSTPWPTPSAMMSPSKVTSPSTSSPSTVLTMPLETPSEATAAIATEDVDHQFDRYSTGMQVAEALGPSQRGKCAIITGANSGIGFETARCLALNGIHVVMACRSVASASDAAFRIRKMKDGCRIDVMELDLSSLQSVHRFATDFKQHGWPLSILICCASIMGVPYAESSEGVEMHFAVNHLGHFYLTKLLTPTLCRSAPSRVVVVASEMHRIAPLSGCSGRIDFDRDIPMPRSRYWPLLAYIQSKLCNLLFVQELQRRLQDRNVLCLAVHPGMTSTSLTRHSWAMKAAYSLFWPFTKSVEQAAATVVYSALHSAITSDTLYVSDCRQTEPGVEAKDSDLAKHLWGLSEILCNSCTLID